MVTKRNYPRKHSPNIQGNLSLTRCIIEIFIEQPLSFQACAKTYSKFLIAISSAGTISCLWGGRVSDKCVTQRSGFLELVEPGDTTMADYEQVAHFT